MKLRRLAGECEMDDCPTVYLSDRGTLVLQGPLMGSADGLGFSAGEGAVELSAALVREALRELGER